MARRPPEGLCGGAAALLLAASLAACADGGDGGASVQPLPPRTPPTPPAAAAASGSPAGPAAPAAGLTPLESPRQLLAAFPIGRNDPFAPLPGAPPAAAAGSAGAGGRAGSAAAPATRSELRLLGVISAGSTAQAMVQFGTLSGVLCPGPQGRCPGIQPDQPLLPPDWRVERIDAAAGLLVLREGRQRHVLSLAPRS